MKFIPFIIGFAVLAIGTWHAVHKPGKGRKTDTLPPNAYDKSGNKDDISV